MKPEIAEQLLYESEATLRLVDALLDELEVAEPLLRDGPVGMHTLQLDAGPAAQEAAELPDLLSAAAAQARAVLSALTRSRGVLERAATSDADDARENPDEGRVAPTAVELRSGLERALLLVDRLEAESGPSGVKYLLRDEILEMLEGVRVQEITEQQLSYASSVLRETETQLSALVQRLSPPRSGVIPFPRGRAQS